MLRATFLLIVSLCSSALPGERDLSKYTYEDYVNEFRTSESLSSGEFGSRKKVFEENLALINKHNEDQTKSWFASVNEFTDWTNEEFRARRTAVKPQLYKLLQSSNYSSRVKLEDLPDSVDWREKGVVTPVKNQGSCGSCWAFSATQTMESHYAISTGEAVPVLSPQQITSCTPNPNHCGGSGGCKGSIQQLAFEYTETAGLTTDDNYPYRATTGTCDESKINPVAKNSGYVTLPQNDYTALMTAVATKGPMAISVAAGAIGWQVYGGGVFKDGLVFKCGYVEDHAVQLVGYGVDNSDLYWTVRNSWGSFWGEGGYIRIQRFGEGDEPCGVDKKPQDGSACEGETDPITLCGLCAILSDSSYPTGVTKAASSVIV